MSCSYCGTQHSTTCIERVLLFNTNGSTSSTQKEPIPYGSEPMFEDWRPSHHCPECGVGEGNYHHERCEIEICPQCGEQLVRCDCLPGVTEPQPHARSTD